MNRRLVVPIAIAFVLLFALARTGFLRYWTQASKPLGEGPRVEFTPAGISQAEREQFMDRDFTIVRDVRALPRPVLEAFTEQGGSRLLIANPGRNFEVGDVIYDPSLPQKRLIFAGVVGDSCFVHYEQGGRAHMYVLALFNVTSSDTMKPLWRGYCIGPAANVSALLSQVVSGNCR